MSSVVQKAHTNPIDSYVPSPAHLNQLDVATALNAIASSEQSKSIVCSLRSSSSSVEWIDAMIMDGGIWLCTHLHRDSHAQAGGSGGGRCGEGGGVNYLASNFSYLNDCMEAVPQTQQ